MSNKSSDIRIERIVAFISNKWFGLTENRKTQVWLTLSFLLKTYRRLSRLKFCIASIFKQNTCSQEKKIEAIKPSPEVWLNLPPRKSNTPKVVDVIIPVYDGLSETLRCIYSVLTAKNNTNFEIVVINDKSPNRKLVEELRRLSERQLITFYENDLNLGFVKSTNFGMSLHPDRDVIWLNSDTEVFDHWVDRILEVSKLDQKISTITPLTNNGTICSYPKTLQDNYNIPSISDELLSKIAYEVNGTSFVEAPTGVGFCMYVKRKALLEVGMLDEVSFGKGYGEENDLCQRFSSAGYKNIIFPGVFVRHYGAASFKSTSAKRIENAIKILNGKHPSYSLSVSDFERADPLERYRVRLDCARLKHERRELDKSASMDAILIITHSRGGGTEKFVNHIRNQEELDGQIVYVLRSRTPCWIQLESDSEDYPNLQAISANYGLDCFEDILGVLGIKKIHINSLVDYPDEFSEFILKAIQNLNIEVAITLHDYHVFCPRINLLNRGMWNCDKLDISRCGSCCKLSSSIPIWRKIILSERLLKNASKVTVPSNDMRLRLQPVFPTIAFKVIKHHELPANTSLSEKELSLVREEKSVLGIIGAISIAKGYDIVKRLSQTMGDEKIVLIGYSCNDEGLKKNGVEITGEYKSEEEALESIVKEHVNCIFIPSIWPETHSYTLSIALRTGLPVFTFDCGAPAERLRELGLDGYVLPMKLLDNPKQIWEEIEVKRQSFKPYVYRGQTSHWNDYFI